MADYQETVRARMKDLSSLNAATRREAAYYLGEAGVDEAITKLATVYKSDPDPGVRKAAAYALGMFRAVEQALARGEQDRVLKLLRRVVDEGKFGKRLRLRPAVLARIELVLALVFVVLLALHFVLPDLGPLPGGITLPSLTTGLNEGATGDNDTVLERTHITYTSVRNDLDTLQSQFQSVLTGGSLNCTAFFNLPKPVDTEGIGALPGDLAGLVEAVNAGQVVVMAGYARLDSACYEDQPIEAAEVGGLLAPVITAQRALADLEPLFTVGAPVAASPEPSPTPTTASTDAPPTETPLPTEIPATPTPTLSMDPRDHVTALYGIIDSVSGPRNAVGLLRQAWTDTANAGTTRACTEPQPVIPADYVLPPGDAEALPELAQAAEQVNLALTLLRQGWDLFTGACASNALLQQAGAGLQTATTAEDALRVADGLLQAIRAGL